MGLVGLRLAHLADEASLCPWLDTTRRGDCCSSMCCQDQPWCLTKEAPCKGFANIVAQNSANRGGSEFCISADVILFFKQPHLSQVRQRSAVVAAAVNNDVINNDVAPSHRHRRMESISKY